MTNVFREIVDGLSLGAETAKDIKSVQVGDHPDLTPLAHKLIVFIQDFLGQVDYLTEADLLTALEAGAAFLETKKPAV